jgi:hypothetical protein
LEDALLGFAGAFGIEPARARPSRAVEVREA